MTEHSKERDYSLTEGILRKVAYERSKQFGKWGRQRLPSVKDADQVGTAAFPLEVSEAYMLPREADAKEACENAAKREICTFGHIMVEEAVEVLNAATEEDRGVELIQLAAVCVQWVEELIRQRVEDMEDGKAPMTQFRWHRGGLGESMSTVVPCTSMDELLGILRTGLFSSEPTADSVVVKPYGRDDRIGWDTYIVTVDGSVAGMADGPLPASKHSDERCKWTGLGTCPTCGEDVGRVL